MTEFDLRQYGIQVSKPVCKPKEDDSYEEKKVFQGMFLLNTQIFIHIHLTKMKIYLIFLQPGDNSSRRKGAPEMTTISEITKTRKKE